MRRVNPFVRITLPGIVLAAVAAGCGTTTPEAPAATSAAPAAAAPATATATAPASASPSSSPAGSYRQQVLDWGRRFSECARTRGIANFPDPVLMNIDDQGADGVTFPGVDKRVIERAQEMCIELVRQMPPPPENRRQSPERLAQMRRFADCMRQHGVTDFPDPKANGTFPLRGTRLRIFGPGYIQDLPRDLAQAYDACFHLQTDWRMQVS